MLFSASRNQLLPLHEAPPFASLERLFLAADQIDQGDYRPSDNLLSASVRFGIEREDVREVITSLFHITERAGDFFGRAGMNIQDVDILSKVCRRFNEEIKSW